MPGINYSQGLDDEITRLRDPNAGQAALTRTVGATVQQAMPSFYSALQNIRESAVRRGISTGDLGTSYEGDLASAFQNNIANATASQAVHQDDARENNYLDLLSGQADRQTAADNRRRSRRGGLGAALGGLAGGIGGFFLGGPGGGMAGASAGSSLGSRIGGLFGGS